jgi:hypothetical protein
MARRKQLTLFESDELDRYFQLGKRWRSKNPEPLAGDAEYEAAMHRWRSRVFAAAAEFRHQKQYKAFLRGAGLNVE